MTESRHQNLPLPESPQESAQEPRSDDHQAQAHVKPTGRPPGRPRGRGRPKLADKPNAKKKRQESEIQESPVKPRERQKNSSQVQQKQSNNIEGYVKIVDYLKKIESDDVSFQNKMNPYHGLTATCFWYMVSAEYFSYDFYSRSNPLEAANQVLNRVARIPLQLSNRFIKNMHQGSELQFQTEEVRKYGSQIAAFLGQLIPDPLGNLSKPENIDRKLTLSTVSEDNEFISSTRALLFNYVKGQLATKERWANNIQSKLDTLRDLESKQVEKSKAMRFDETKEAIMDDSALDYYSRQIKKSKSELKKFKSKKSQSESNAMVTEEKGSQLNLQCREDNRIEEEGQQLQEHSQGSIDSGAARNSNSQKQSLINSSLEKIVIEQQKAQPISQQQNQQQQSDEDQTYQKAMTSDEVLLSSILNLPLEKVISILESNIPKVQLPEIEPSFLPISKNDPLELVYQLHDEEEAYMQYLKEYQKRQYENKLKKNESSIEQEERETQCEDAKCQICTDGDYTDDNLIVFCSRCNISLHQRCVGLAKVPAESWVCEVCQAFGPNGVNLPCPLCNVKGGALKRTNIHIDTHMFKDTNPAYNQYTKKCLYSKQKEEYVPLTSHSKNNQKIEAEAIQDKGHERVEDRPGDEGQDKQNSPKREKLPSEEEGEDKEELYYDYFNKATYPKDATQPICHFVWVHYVCSIWVPECYFEQKNGNINVKGIQNIDKRRFKHQCVICGKNKAGACVKCEETDCRRYYHPECARKKKVYMEQLNLEKIKYLVFCEAHEPLKITRQIEYKKKKGRDQIIKFARMIEKFVETYKIAYFPYKLPKIVPAKSFIQTFEEEKPKQIEDPEKQQIAMQTDDSFIKEIMLKLSKAKQITVTVEKTPMGFKILETSQPSRREMKKCLNRYDDFWHTLDNGETAEENCRRYDRIMKENYFLKEIVELFLSGESQMMSKNANLLQSKPKRGRSRGRNAKPAVETLIEEEGGIFCICRKPYENEMDMFECEICGQWYHYNCIGFTGTEEQAQGLDFICMKCMKFKTEQQKSSILKTCKHLFAPDSVYLNYSPPTPKLDIQENEIDIKDSFKLECNVQEAKRQQRVAKPEKNKKTTKQKKTKAEQSHSSKPINQKANLKVSESKSQNNQNLSKGEQKKVHAQNTLHNCLDRSQAKATKSGDEKHDQSIEAEPASSKTPGGLSSKEKLLLLEKSVLNGDYISKGK